jgi:hypothetical protein
MVMCVKKTNDNTMGAFSHWLSCSQLKPWRSIADNKEANFLYVLLKKLKAVWQNIKYILQKLFSA